MSLLSLIAVFLLEQLQPLNYRRLVEEPLAAWADFIAAHFDGGEYRHGVIAWCVAVLLPVALLIGLYGLLYAISPLFGWLLNIAVLYLMLGFRQFSHHYTAIEQALRADDLPLARHLLNEWQGRAADTLGSQEVARLSIEAGLLAAHRHVFAIIVCFVLLPGPAGALLYRTAALIGARWQAKNKLESDQFSTFSTRVFGIIDWLPSRVTAAAFAIVGDFEDAVYCWRTQAGQWVDRNAGIVLASGAGALGVQLGRPLLAADDGSESAELGLGDAADVDFMQSAIGLVWRATVLWMLLLFLLGLASLVG